MSTTRTYRPDIDGLRAVAVLSVMLYHFGIDAFPGGFTGVDVFFVISGYLITSIIHREMLAGQFSFANFYRRRVRRIAPALAAVLLASTVAASFLLMPRHLTAFGESAAASGLGIANIYFLHNTGYFDRVAEDLPLLHMWSLAIEEQFYLVWPVLLLALSIWRKSFTRNAIIALGTLILASFAWAEFVLARAQEDAFFLPHLRAWELALGALVALLPDIRSRLLGEALAALGLALIAWGVFALSADSPFPGHNALYPCIGAALVVWRKTGPTQAARLLAISPAVRIGLISYSLYLWHWPILVFFRAWNNGMAPEGIETLALIALSLAVSTLSWLYIEQPFRRPARRVSLPWPAALAGLGAAVLAGGSVALAAGMPSRIPADLRPIEAYLDYARPPVPASVCNFRNDDWRDEKSPCLSGLNGRPRALVIGDSHAGHYVAALADRFPEIHFSFFTKSHCRPVLEPTGEAACVEKIRQAYSEIIPQGVFDVVILAARWRNGQWEQVGASIEYLRAHVPTVIVFGQTIEYRTGVPEILLSSALPRRERLELRQASYVDKLRPINAQLRAMTEAAGAQFYDPLEAFCDADNCHAESQHVPLQWDYGHLTYEGAVYVLDQFRAQGLFAAARARVASR